MSKNSILIVEDEAIIAYDLADNIKRMGHEVTGVTDTGEEAVQLVRQHRPALILMDIHLAGEMDGVAAAQQIYQEFKVPILFLTANYELCSEESAQLTGAVGCIKKPFDKVDIRSQIEKFLA